ncbi:MAG: TrmH family RNA methyltransferase [Nitrospirota bacterium]
MKSQTTEIISSRSNKTIKYLKSLSLSRNRQKEGRFMIEGIRITEEILERRCCVRKLIISPHAAQNERAAMLVGSAKEQGIEVMWVAERVIDYLSETKSSQGVMALVEPQEFSEDDLEKGQMPMIVVAHLLQDPGNLGTIVRVAEAAGAGGVVTTPGTVDFYNPKALRATMGSIFRLPSLRTSSLEDFIQRFKSRGYQVVAAMVSARKKYFDIDYARPTVLLLGQEGTGLPPEVGQLADHKVSIPMATMIDSLNVASAASVILYEAVRQNLVPAENLVKK